MKERDILDFNEIANKYRVSDDILKQSKAADNITPEQYSAMTALLAVLGKRLSQYEVCGIFDILWRATNRMLEDMDKKKVRTDCYIETQGLWDIFISPVKENDFVPVHCINGNESFIEIYNPIDKIRPIVFDTKEELRSFLYEKGMVDINENGLEYIENGAVVEMRSGKDTELVGTLVYRARRTIRKDDYK